jgi:hypothetical protein
MPQLLRVLEELDHHSIDSEAASGFCYLPCWWNSDHEKQMTWQARVQEDALERSLPAVGRALELVDVLLQQSRRPAGTQLLQRLRCYLIASRHHFMVSDTMRRMRQCLLDADGRDWGDTERQRFEALGQEALAHAIQWMDHTARAIADRGVEGSLVSYDHVIITYIRRFLASYGTAPHPIEEQPGIAASLQAPPPLERLSEGELSV